MVCVGLIGARLGLLDVRAGDMLAFEWAPRIALTSVAAGLFGVVVALFAGFSQFWLRAMLAVAITSATLFAYVWDRDVRQPAAAVSAPVQALGR